MSAICPECTGHSGQHALGCDRAKPRDRVEEQTLDHVIALVDVEIAGAASPHSKLKVLRGLRERIEMLRRQHDHPTPDSREYTAFINGFGAGAHMAGVYSAQDAWEDYSKQGDHPTPEEQLQAAFRAGFEWASNGTDKHGEYNGGSIEDGFEQWARAPRPATPEEQD